MPNVLDDFEALKRKVADAQRRRDTAEGERKAALRRLKEEFGCADEAAAKKLLAQLRDEELRLAEEYGAAKEQFEQEYADILR